MNYHKAIVVISRNFRSFSVLTINWVGERRISAKFSEFLDIMKFQIILWS